MSDSAPTISQPTSATTGLQPYDLRGGRNPRVWSNHEVRAGTKQGRLRRIRRSWTAAMQKGQVMSQLPQMFETLEKSVVSITESGSDNLAELLTKTFSEFREAIEPELEKSVGEAANAVIEQHAAENPDAFETPLYKGLGAVGRVANLVSMMANAIKRIDDGKEYDSDQNSDPASDDVMAFLEHALAAAELALRAAVNEHVDVVGDDEEPEEGMNYVTVPNAEAPDDEDAALVLKTALPGELAKFAADPAGLSMAVIELGGGMLLHAGVQEEALGKLFEPEAGELAKFGGAAAPSPDASQDPSQDPGADAGGDPNDIEAQIEIMGRICAAGLMQVDHIMQMLGASGGAGDPSQDPGADAGVDDGTDPGQMPAGGDQSQPGDTVPPTEQDPKKKPPVAKSAEADDLRKVVAELENKLAKAVEPNAELAELRKTVGSLQGQMRQIAAQPAAAKAVLAGASMTKAADNGDSGADTVLEKLAAEYDACRTDDQRNLVLAKAAFKLPGADLSALRKTV